MVYLSGRRGGFRSPSRQARSALLPLDFVEWLFGLQKFSTSSSSRAGVREPQAADCTDHTGRRRSPSASRESNARAPLLSVGIPGATFLRQRFVAWPSLSVTGLKISARISLKPAGVCPTDLPE